MRAQTKKRFPATRSSYKSTNVKVFIAVIVVAAAFMIHFQINKSQSSAARDVDNSRHDANPTYFKKQGRWSTKHWACSIQNPHALLYKNLDAKYIGQLKECDVFEKKMDCNEKNARFGL